MFGRNGYKWDASYKKTGKGYKFTVNMTGDTARGYKMYSYFHSYSYNHIGMLMNKLSRKLRSNVQKKYKLKNANVVVVLKSKDGKIIKKSQNGSIVYDKY
ncbi:hypothetical protein [Butyrivibrio sp. INlla16]|uniref:hypothetical protein n=1 Tax=Butyrivibrio sp. INlla16 TaxID=1520807 RepID=UPI00087E0D43|nr:hypothetical protein [Butyrivibrio sp. INlla16]SDB34990.1 hypothetical protein SAMN02910263_01694 [Butyrivibrio sp. INlla16]